jgi:hypothetical protein
MSFHERRVNRIRCCFHLFICFHHFFTGKSPSEVSGKNFLLCERAFRSRLTLRKEGQGRSRGRHLTHLARLPLWQTATVSVNTIFACRRFRFHKSSQHFIGTHDKTLSVAMRVNNPDCSPFAITAETQPQLHPALLRLSVMISQYFIKTLLVLLPVIERDDGR